MLSVANFSPILIERTDDLRENLEVAIRDLEQEFGISITIHDHCGAFRDDEGHSILSLRRQHWNPYCRIDRDGTVSHCMNHCGGQVHIEAGRRREPFWSLCWKGVREVVVPLIRDDTHLATLFAGAWRRPRARPDFTTIPNGQSLVTEWRRLPVIENKREKRIARHLELWGNGLLDALIAQKDALLEPSNRLIQVVRFVHRHAHHAVTLGDLAHELNLSPSRASHIVTEGLGCSFQELVLRERIERARALLLSSPHTIAGIAQRCGFNTLQYFSRVFKARTGVSPGRFREIEPNRIRA